MSRSSPSCAALCGFRRHDLGSPWLLWLRGHKWLHLCGCNLGRSVVVYRPRSLSAAIAPISLRVDHPRSDNRHRNFRGSGLDAVAEFLRRSSTDEHSARGIRPYIQKLWLPLAFHRWSALGGPRCVYAGLVQLVAGDAPWRLGFAAFLRHRVRSPCKNTLQTISGNLFTTL